MKAMPEPSIVAASTHGPAFHEQGAIASLARITPASHGCLMMPTILVLLSATISRRLTIVCHQASPLALAEASGERRVLF
jgi:hypothetical protein